MKMVFIGIAVSSPELDFVLPFHCCTAEQLNRLSNTSFSADTAMVRMGASPHLTLNTPASSARKRSSYAEERQMSMRLTSKLL